MARISAGIVLAVLIALLCAYGGLYAPGPTLDECLADPAAFDGAVVYAPRESVVGSVTNDGFILKWAGREFPVRGVARNARPGHYVGVRGIFRSDGFIEAEAIHVGRFRRLKIAMSVVGACVMFALFLRGYTWDRAQRGFRPR